MAWGRESSSEAGHTERDRVMSSINSQGLLLMPDISGFTEFVSEVEISHSEHIISELLELLINGNQLGLELCEIEGDALFFYRQGPAPSHDAIMAQVRHWFTAFHNHLKLVSRDVYCKCGACQNVGNLALKTVGHFGEFAVYSVQKKTKVIGKDVILVHRLLKNSIPEREYLFVTDALLRSLSDNGADTPAYVPHQERYDIIGEVTGGVLDLAPMHAELPDVPPQDDVPRLDGELWEETEIRAPYVEVVKTVADIEGWPRWIEGLSHQEIDRSAPIKAGHHHVCVFPGLPIEITVEQIAEREDEFVMVETLSPLPALKKLMVVQQVRKTPGGAQYRFTYTYAPKAFRGRAFERKIAPMLRDQLRQSLSNLKTLLETPA